MCVNYDHLFLGTNTDNMADKFKKGKQAKGERISEPTKRALAKHSPEERSARSYKAWETKRAKSNYGYGASV